MITVTNPVHARCCWCCAFFTSAAIWLLIEAEFLAVVLVLVYVGAVMVLFLFVVMMLDINIEELRAGFTRYAWFGGIVAGVVVVRDRGAWSWTRRHGHRRDHRRHAASRSTTATPPSSARCCTPSTCIAFELAAVLLLIAIVAAISLTMRKRPNLKLQDVGEAGRRAPRRPCAQSCKMAAERPLPRRAGEGAMIPLQPVAHRSPACCSPFRWRACSSTARTSSCC